ncbi:MAG: thiamine diphosphokinase [Cardiobacteriales bacterium]|nr:MAG: thiamine diphosphokinase [Cardiobacteriales bacterium]
MKVWLLLNGRYATPPIVPDKTDVVIAVDGGMRHALQLNVIPSLWIGDFDSTPKSLMAQYPQVSLQVFPTLKDDTDLGLALKHIRRSYSNVEQITLIGAFGNEFDHVFANFWLLPHFQIPVIAWGEENHAVYLPAKTKLLIEGVSGALVSVFALSPLSGVTYQGLQWHLQEADIPSFSAFSARNVLVGNQAKIDWQHGDGLIVLEKSSFAKFL